ncbi:MAG: DedA family protein [bacterium]|nr:DedA family protein [bacterium]
MLPVTQFIESYGYLAVFVGSIFEGESVVLLGGLSSHGEYLSFSMLVLFAAIGAVVGDWSFFFLGRYKRDWIFARFPYFRHLIRRPSAFVERRPEIASFSMRFMYGFRHVVPFSMGTTSIPTSRFLMWNALGAVCWAIIFVSAGYLAGDVLEAILGDIRRYEFRIIVLSILAVITLNLIVRNVRAWLRRNTEK